MKKILFFFLFFSINLYGQIDFSTFPKIGFSDMYYLMNAPLYLNNSPQLWSNYESRDFYYPELRDLGLNHVVTFGGNFQKDDGTPIPEYSLDPDYNNTLKVLDFYFVSRLTRYFSGKQFFGSVYAGAQGNTGANAPPCSC